MAKIQLKSFYHAGKTHGKPGDVIEVSDEIANRIQSGRGGVILDGSAKEGFVKESKKQSTEKATDSKAANSEKSTK